jgi:hypothetical protein
MVFFMAMPLLFGFLGNFLLPTQMGVHDVAFPRMNSAAFWFLPASLLALCQLVCIDRRYQRMNCFNIKEVQSLLRNRFIHETPYNKSIFQSDNGITSSLGSLTNRSSYPLTKHSTQSNFNPFNSKGGFSLIGNPLTPTKLPLQPKASFFNESTLNSFHPSLAFNLMYTSLYTLNYTLVIVFAKLITSLNFATTFPTPLFNTYYTAFRSLLTNSYLSKNEARLLNSPQGSLFTSQLTEFKSFYLSKFSFLDQPTILYKIKTGNYLPDGLFKVNFYFLYNTINYKTMLKQLRGGWFESSACGSDVYSRFSSLNGFSKVSEFNFNKTSVLDVVNTSSYSFFKPSILQVSSTYVNLLSTLNVDLEVLILNQTKQARILNN